MCKLKVVAINEFSLHVLSLPCKHMYRNCYRRFVGITYSLLYSVPYPHTMQSSFQKRNQYVNSLMCHTICHPAHSYKRYCQPAGGDTPTNPTYCDSQRCRWRHIAVHTNTNLCELISATSVLVDLFKHF